MDISVNALQLILYKNIWGTAYAEKSVKVVCRKLGKDLLKVLMKSWINSRGQK